MDGPNVTVTVHYCTAEESQVLRHIVEYVGKGIDDDEEEEDDDEDDDDDGDDECDDGGIVNQQQKDGEGITTNKTPLS